MNFRFLSRLLATFALFGSTQALAAPDSLLQAAKGDGKTFTLYYLHSLADGTTVIDEAPVHLVDRKSAAGESKILFDGPLSNLSIRWHPNGNLPPKDAPPNHEKGARLLLVTHGAFVVEVSNGKRVTIKPGNFLLQTDTDGFGHKMHCNAPKDGLGCVQITMDAADPESFFKTLQR